MAELSDRAKLFPQSSGSKDRRHAVVLRGNASFIEHPIPNSPGTNLRHFTDLCSTDRTMDIIRDIFMYIIEYAKMDNLVYMYMYTKLYTETDIEMDIEMDTKMDGIAYNRGLTDVAV
jgi:hypothetical protein